ncbi:MAG: phosphoribosylanthranilate isomerase [Bacteroidaceae bacterium]|nr:phosphoribosylanthranilate isomerase [Bacteroidaceae bacterium]
MRAPENIRAIEMADPDMMGFICWEKSSRYVGNVPTYLPSCLRVGVFVNPRLEYVMKRAHELRLDYIQLHGTESSEFCIKVLNEIGLPIIKAISVKTTKDIDTWEEYENIVNLLLFDTKCKSTGGSGEQFDWDILNHYQGNIPFFLAGGIGPEDAERLHAWHHPMYIGIDINSRFEDAPAMKNVKAVTQFIRKIRSYE